MNHYYKIGLGNAYNDSEYIDELLKAVPNNRMRYRGELGEYVQLNDNTKLAGGDSTDDISIGNINKALAEYWDEMGIE